MAAMTECEEPRWLDEQERAAWMALAVLLVRLPSKLDAQLRRDGGISHFEYQIMAGLSEAEGRRLRMNVLAAFTEGSLQRLSQAVGRLEKRGWVRREADASDGRYTLAILTDAGWDTIVALAPGHVETVRTHVFDALTRSQIGQLERIARRILTAIDPDGDQPMTGTAARADAKASADSGSSSSEPDR